MDADDFCGEELAVVQAAIDERQWEIEEEELEYQASADMGTIAYGLELGTSTTTPSRASI